jgi:transcriptional regulator with XRE-family HTH domain
LGESAKRIFDGKPLCRASRLSKTIHTERHRKLRAMLLAERKAAGLTQTIVATRLGRPPSYVAKYELGDRRLDILEYLDIATAIGFDPCKALRSLFEIGSNEDDHIKTEK